MTPTWQSWGGLTQRHQEPADLHHHLLVQGPLGWVQLPPLLLGEGHSHITEGHRYLVSQTEEIELALELLDWISHRLCVMVKMKISRPRAASTS